MPEVTTVVLDATTGARVADPERRYGENWHTSDDLLVFEGTANDLLELAEALEKRARTPGYQSNTTLRMARELRDAADPRSLRYGG